jgi:hypothetical protein
MVLIAASIAAGARADEPAAAAPRLKGEIAWARATWPDTFKGVRFQVPLATLRGWAPARGSVPAHLFVEKNCLEVMIERDRWSKNEGDEEEGWALVGKIFGTPTMEKGRETRAFRYIQIGEEMSATPANYSVEVRDAKGRWRPEGSVAAGMEPHSYGWLSYADDRVARWDAEPMRLDITCKGPVEWLDCAGTGGRNCERCDDHYVSLWERDAELLFGERPPLRPATCQDPCPPPVDSPDIARLRRLSERVDLWRPKRSRIADVASLYLSRDDCLREHPQAARAKDKDQ